jgi:Alginate lyase
MRTTLVITMMLGVLCAARVSGAEMAPSSAFELRDWKPQIPGPREVRNLAGHASDYFYLDGNRAMVFHLNAAEAGTTANAHLVRSELRHLPNWDNAGNHTLSAEVRVESRQRPDKVTVVQVHSITRDGKNAPPLLRIAVNNGDLVAIVKTTSEGDRNDTVMLIKGLASDYAKLEVTVDSGRLQVRVNDEKKLERSLGFWKFNNYFKAGAYPQATEGRVDVVFRKLSAN